MAKKIITKEFLEAGRSDAGGWNYKQLEVLGVEIPPLKGWPRKLIGKEIAEEAYERFLALRGKTLKVEKREAREKKQDTLF